MFAASGLSHPNTLSRQNIKSIRQCLYTIQPQTGQQTSRAGHWSVQASLLKG